MSMVTEARAADEARFLETLMEKSKHLSAVDYAFLVSLIWDRYVNLCTEAFIKANMEFLHFAKRG